MATSARIDPKAMRRHNLALVLREVAGGGGASRAEIAAGTGLNKTTVSSLVADLIARGLLRETGVQHRGGVGRPGVAIELDGEHFVALGLEVNVDHLSFAAVDLLGRVRDEGFVRRDNRGRPATDTLASLALIVAQALERLRDGGLTPVGATLGLPGLIDGAGGRLLVAPNLGWREVPVVELLREALADADGEFDIRIENEANLGALAERREGAGRAFDDFLYVSGYIGVGAGLIVGGELHRGATGFGGEFGHMTLEASGPPCRCGSRGCVEALVGLEALLRLAGRDLTGLRSPGSLAAVTPVAGLVAAAQQGHGLVLDALQEVGTRLGAGLASAANLLGPTAVVLGGYFGALHEWLREPISAELARRVLSFPWSPVDVLQTQVTGGAAVRGAAGMTLSAMLADPASVTAPLVRA